ncbi:hypothetical protein ACFYST_06050 [Kitasatospora sp. NPDC004614]|uniref:hypothetical protein n=1 Tax=unclassified Kitasatospora TaxID=2633591 RepID=UPI0036929C6B
MYLVYKPEGSAEPTRWKYDPKRLMSPEMEKLERLTDRTYGQFVSDVQSGSALCRRALLYVFQKRQHPTLKFNEVTISWGELDFEYSRAELLEIRADVAENASADKRDSILAKIDEEITDAFDDEDLGKAELPSGD